MKEGYWDSRSSVAGLVKLMEIEEDGVVGDYIPGSRRVRVLEEVVNPGERWAAFKYMRGIGDGGDARRDVYWW